MDRKWLPLNALRAFEAAGQHLSFTAAANSLTVAQSAVSRHVIVLENFLGVALFERRPQQLVLTEAGRHILPVVSKSFDRIDQALGEVIKEKGQAEAGLEGRAADVVRPSARHSDFARFSLRKFRASRSKSSPSRRPGRKWTGTSTSPSSIPSRVSPTRSMISYGWCARPSCAARSCIEGIDSSDPGTADRRQRPPAPQDRRSAAALLLGNVRALDRTAGPRRRSRPGVRHPATCGPVRDDGGRAGAA